MKKICLLYSRCVADAMRLSFAVPRDDRDGGRHRRGPRHRRVLPQRQQVSEGIGHCQSAGDITTTDLCDRPRHLTWAYAYGCGRRYVISRCTYYVTSTAAIGVGPSQVPVVTEGIGHASSAMVTSQLLITYVCNQSGTSASATRLEHKKTISIL